MSVTVNEMARHTDQPDVDTEPESHDRSVPAGPGADGSGRAPAGPLALSGRVQQYSWGDPAFIPSLLGIEKPSGPYAELWLGAHPLLPATVHGPGESVPLDRLVQSHPSAVLGPSHGQPGFPYLLKVLAAARPLSIQVHPNRTQAAAGFAGAGRNDPARPRTYGDPSHKPELLVALTPTYALAGFRPLSTLQAVFDRVPEIAGILPRFDGTASGLKMWLAAYFALQDSALLAAHNRWLARLARRQAITAYEVADPEHWVLVADRQLGRPGVPDRGLLFVLLLNLVRLEPGEGLFVPAGLPHAYLQGAGVELMASSDNVLRCGLTHKPLDVPEMLRVLDYRGSAAPVIRPTWREGQQVYRTPATEFELRVMDVAAERSWHSVAAGPEIWLAIGPRAPVAAVCGPGGERVLSGGDCCLMLDAEAVRVRGIGAGRLFRVTAAPTGQEKIMDMKFRGNRPAELTFGTSGLRGLITDITDLEAYVNTRGFLDYCLANGDVTAGGEVALAGDLRPSTHSADRSILRAVAAAVVDAGMRPIHCGLIPTPALSFYALQREIPSIMVTGSHIPFDRNGIKFNRASGEVLKADEEGILTCVARARADAYRAAATDSPFDDDGMFKQDVPVALPVPNDTAAQAYLRRYVDAFGDQALVGLKILFYEHSAVGRELIPQILRSLGATVFVAGRTTTFVALDTEALAPETLPLLQKLHDEVAAREGSLSAVVSTDGDSDRPLVLGVDGRGQLQFVSGDRLGIVVADMLAADAVAVPVSSTDAVEQQLQRQGVSVARTRIGSPYVIAEMQHLTGQRVVGWEANGGFLVGSSIEMNPSPPRQPGAPRLAPLLTRDAVLPICALLRQVNVRGLTVCQLAEALPNRFTAAGLLDGVAVEQSARLLSLLGADGAGGAAAHFDGELVEVIAREGATVSPDPKAVERLQAARSVLQRHVPAAADPAQIQRIDYTDGVRVFLDSGDIVHIRPSGNAPQLRLYAVADTQSRADALVASAIVEPSGFLLKLLAVADEEAFVQAVRDNVTLADRLCAEGGGPAIIGAVSGSASAQAFWQTILDRAGVDFHARRALSFHEDLPVNQAFGLLLLWQRLRGELRSGEGALVAFVFGEGSRATPLTETDNGQKPALLSPVRTSRGDAPGEYLSMVELALRHFVPVEAYLRRSGFDGLVVKWGDEVQIPTRSLVDCDARFAEADIVRFVSMRPMAQDDAANKDWVGVDDAGEVTAFIPRRPLSEMQVLADSGRLLRKGDQIFGGVNLGSIGLSRRLLDGLLAEFAGEVNDATADRKQRPDLDPQLFTALIIAMVPDRQERNGRLKQACEESTAMAELLRTMPNVVDRLRSVISTVEREGRRPVRAMALDFCDQYWGDIGQHRQMRSFYMALADDGPTGRIARALSGLPEHRDGRGNVITEGCRIAPGVHVSDSVLIDVTIEGRGRVQGAVLIGSHLGDVDIERGFDVKSVAPSLRLAPESGCYQVVSDGAVVVEQGERLTTLFLPDGPEHYRVHEDTNLRQRAQFYDVPVFGNPRAFAEAHRMMSEAGATEVSERRRQARERVVATLATHSKSC